MKGTSEELREAAKEYDGHCLALSLLGSYLEDACEGDVRKRKEIGPLEEDEPLGGHAQRVMAAYERWFQGEPEVAILRMVGLFDRPAEEGGIAALRAAPTIEGLTDALIGPTRSAHVPGTDRLGLVRVSPFSLIRSWTAPVATFFPWSRPESHMVERCPNTLPLKHER